MTAEGPPLLSWRELGVGLVGAFALLAVVVLASGRPLIDLWWATLNALPLVVLCVLVMRLRYTPHRKDQRR